MELRWIVRHYGEFKDQPILQYRTSSSEEWQDVPTIIMSMK